jgi:hypothetical protein
MPSFVPGPHIRLYPLPPMNFPSGSGPSPTLDFNGRPYHPDLSPFPRRNGSYFEDLTKVPADSFALPENASSRKTDRFFSTTEGRGWIAITCLLNTVKTYTCPIIRLIADDPILYARMQHYAKTGDAAAALRIGVAEPAPVVVAGASGNYAATPLGASLTPKPINPANFIIDLAFASPDLVAAVQHLLFAAGLKWFNAEPTKPIPDKWLSNRGLFVIREACPAMTPGLIYHGSPNTAAYPFPVYSAQTALPEIIRLLNGPFDVPPAPVAPEVHGYTARYAKGADLVEFGCAKISLVLLRDVALLMGLTAIDGSLSHREPVTRGYGGNRTVTSITLSSGKTLSREQAKAILDYVKAVNGA